MSCAWHSCLTPSPPPTTCSEDETKVLNARIEKLTAILEGVNVEHGMLLEQVKTSEEGLYKARKANIALKADKVRGLDLCTVEGSTLSLIL